MIRTKRDARIFIDTYTMHQHLSHASRIIHRLAYINKRIIRAHTYLHTYYTRYSCVKIV